MKRLALCVLLLVIAVPSFAWQATVVSVSDGDTITVLRHGCEQYKIRLYGIDAPERSQPHGKASKANLSKLVFGKTVDVDPADIDKYGRTVAKISVGGVSANAQQLSDGYAWLYRQYCEGALCSEWADLEARAKFGRVGLWSDAAPVAPWTWRHKGASPAADKSPKTVIALQAGPFHGNANSGVFHRPGCRHYNCRNCIAVFSSRTEALANGYRPCKICKP